jgi:hypothetical protein
LQRNGNFGLEKRDGNCQAFGTYTQEKNLEGKAVIALDQKNIWDGFCYIESWQSGEYAANSGLIVSTEFRNSGVARLMHIPLMLAKPFRS